MDYAHDTHDRTRLRAFGASSPGFRLRFTHPTSLNHHFPTRTSEVWGHMPALEGLIHRLQNLIR
jgi:hypothetical protein